MSISAVANNIYNPYQAGTSAYQQQMQKLSQDLQSGNISAAQSDFATLQQSFSQPSTTTAASTASNSINQAFNQLASDLKSGNLSAAQKDFATVQKDLQQARGPLPIDRFRHQIHFGGGPADTDGQSSGQINPQSSNSAAAAQQAYSTLTQQFQQFALGGGSTSASQATALQNQPPLSLVA